ncbi:MAG: uroporphyrinogen-III synthase [Methylomonas sp.]|nr:uroporphyrinogen-III synthase [Methylomonas sp.]
MTDELKGAVVLVTRPAAQAHRLCELIAQQGGTALRFPTLEIRAVNVETRVIEQSLSRDWLIFTSTNAVDFALKAFDGKMPQLRTLRLAAVGQATANALRQAGLTVACVPEHDFSSEGLLAEADMRQVASQRMTIVRGVGGREKLAQTLRNRGAKVDYLEVYRRCRPEGDNRLLVQHLTEGRLAAITITSGEALENLLTLLDPASNALLRRLPLIVVSERQQQLAKQLGFEQITISRQPTDAAILETLTTLFNGENSGRSN